MKEAICNSCPQGKQIKPCGMFGTPKQEYEILGGTPTGNEAAFVEERAHLECWFYRCSEGQLSALSVYRKHKGRGQQGIYSFGTGHKRQILSEGYGITGRFIAVGENPDLPIEDGDIFVRNLEGTYIHLTNINVRPPRE